MSVRDGTIDELRAAVGLQIADEQLLRTLVAGLDDVEDVLRGVVSSDVAAIDEAARHLVDAGGKRFRPMFTLLASQFGPGGRHEAVVTAAAAVELVHLATLYHDDVMDEATMRRGAPSVNARWDNSVAILTGDYLFAHASLLVADLGTDAARIIAETFGELVTGQMRETVGPQHGDDPVDHYLSVIGQKTGSLIATAGRFGGMFSGAGAERIEALHRFGSIVGTAFQISDDIIDIASPSDTSGKPQGTDLREGVRTLPMHYALSERAPEPRLVELLSGPLTDDASVAEALELLRRSGGLERTRATLADYARRAREELAGLPASPAREACESVADYLVARTH
ncbi:polyprenyl synthetase family protein [Saccharomonospora piscinae]|uniref:Geranylgeranyl pyrophosphate synthase n=1 Tax=Saccharomonospora piscinae TaxID=687388 RepID=A0A1V9A1I9_SACPI|nr:polyprenyl synthetase family protein [Saccharomonospora piscinae]OQO90999.1 geranylgeranyl pyrophosphate synthase [Saccharomonospora piscinae]